MRDVLVIDIETKNTILDVGGDQFIKNLDISLACAYSYNRGVILSFWEDELPKLAELMRTAGLIIGFSINRFDLPVLSKHLPFSVQSLKRLDLLEEIEASWGRRVSLNVLAEANLGKGKTLHSGLEAIRLWNEGKFDELKAYCENDVLITRDLYDFALEKGHVMVPDQKTGALVRIEMAFRDRVQAIVAEATLF
ncbi:MAG: ribonuclease H-like domain-containing protein [Candidatus Colwellbacteria bacterium]|nr:ribonuclease H-like domain-containing protein [Candidatus Colwellbacteria bacterium]